MPWLLPLAVALMSEAACCGCAAGCDCFDAAAGAAVGAGDAGAEADDAITKGSAEVIFLRAKTISLFRLFASRTVRACGAPSQRAGQRTMSARRRASARKAVARDVLDAARARNARAKRAAAQGASGSSMPYSFISR